MFPLLRSVLLWVVLLVAAVALFVLFSESQGRPEALTFTEFLTEVEKGNVSEVTLSGSSIQGKFRVREGRPVLTFRTTAPEYDRLVDVLREGGVRISARQPRTWSQINMVLVWLSVLALIGVWVLFMRQIQAGGNKALSFGKSRAKLLSSQARRVTFSDVAGVDEAKEELQEIIEFLKDPQKFQKLGGKIPKGVLLMGPPGTGKTLLARAIAGEANVPFFSISGSDFVEMFVGVGASRVRDLFEQGKRNAPCIVFIDEIDAVGRHRGAGLGGGHDEREQTLNQLLVEMDGFECNEGVILIAATNRPDVLDPALLRPGRFDRRVVVSRPDVKGRLGILEVHTRRLPIEEGVRLEVIARGTPGFSGADLASLVNEAALYAARFNRKKVGLPDLEYAKDKILMGSEKRSMIISEEERRVTAYHEAGHALVAVMIPDADPIHKVTIIPRGQALGLTQQLPLDDKHTYSKPYLEATLAVMMGGRASEEVFLRKITTGAGNDIKTATDTARRMVCEWGMSETLGPLTFGDKEEQIFLGREIAHHRDYSEQTALLIDGEVKRICTEAYEKALRIVRSERDLLQRVAEALLERETLDADQVRALVRGEALEPLLPPVGTGRGEPAADLAAIPAGLLDPKGQPA